MHAKSLLVIALLACAPTLTLASPTRLTLSAVDREPSAGQDAPSAEELADLQRKVDAAPKDREARFTLVRALMRAEKMQDALEAAQKWREHDAYNLVVVRLLGDIYSELGRQREALRAYSAVVELLPKDARAQRALASVLKQSGNTAAAYARLTAAAKLRPEDQRLSFELADAAHRVGKLNEARQRFEAIRDTAPDAISYPAKQRLAQIYNHELRQARSVGDAQVVAEKTQQIAALKIQGGTTNDIKVYLTWDTDRSDVDLWVTNPAGEKVFYSHKKGQFGGSLYGDVTSGYGPESFTAAKAHVGEYTVAVNYYDAGRSNFSEARGEVVVVLGEGSADETRHVLPYRLFKSGQTVTVARITAK